MNTRPIRKLLLLVVVLFYSYYYEFYNSLNYYIKKKNHYFRKYSKSDLITTVMSLIANWLKPPLKQAAFHSKIRGQQTENKT